jgi:hypothetical protein
MIVELGRLGNILIRKLSVVVSSRKRAPKTVPTLPTPSIPLKSKG